MKLHLDGSDKELHFIQAYATGVITINKQTYRNSVVVCPSQVIAVWQPQTLDDLSADHCQEILNLQPEIVLLGTGKHQHFPAAEILAPVINSGVGLEIMTTAAACRTYNILAGEGRQVVAALLMIEA